MHGNTSSKWASCEFKNMEFYDKFTDLLDFKIYKATHKI